MTGEKSLSLFRIDVSFPAFTSELKSALKKFRTFKADITRALEEIEANPRAGDQIPNTKSNLFKLRIGVKGQMGKSGGYRMIYHIDWDGMVITPIALYFKPDKPIMPDTEVARRFGDLLRHLALTAPPKPPSALPD
jgi:mRNA-degrading endonuclease RelE of RelBE toxin-antitoxin system